MFWRTTQGMRHLFTLLFFLLCLVSSLFGQESLPAVIKRVQPSVVSIVTVNSEGKVTGQGSGFFISPSGDVVTSRHVLDGASRASVINAEGKGFPIRRIVAEDADGDLIQVSVDLDGAKVEPLRLSSVSPEAGERVIVIGTPLGLEKTVSDGIVSAVRDIPEFGKIIQVTAPISPGSSGSPVVNMKGEVIGVATFFVLSGQNLNFAIPAERIRKLIRGEGPTLNEREEQRAEALRASEEYLYATGLRYLWVEDYERALSQFADLIKKNPNHGNAYFQVGYCLGKLGKQKEAIDAYQEALRIMPGDADVPNNLCVAYGTVGRFSEAMASCQQAIRINPGFSEAHNNRAWVLYRMARYEEAVESSREAIRLNPDFAMAHYNQGNAYGGLKRYREAADAYKQAIRIKFDYAEAHLDLGAAYHEMGDYERAAESYRQALRIKPNLPKARLNLGMTYLKQGERGAALDEYKALKELDAEMAKRLFDLIYE